MSTSVCLKRIGLLKTRAIILTATKLSCLLGATSKFWRISVHTLRVPLLIILLAPALGVTGLAADASGEKPLAERLRQDYQNAVRSILRSVPDEDRLYARFLIKIDNQWSPIFFCLASFYNMRAMAYSTPRQVLHHWQRIDLREFDLLIEYCSRPMTSSVEMVIIPKRRNRFEVDGKINRRRVRFLVDTGATHIAIPRNIADSLNLPYHDKIPIMTAGGRTHGWRTTIRSVQIGGYIYIPASSLEAHAAHINTNPADQVLLGMSGLKGIGVFVFRDRMILRQSNALLDSLNPEIGGKGRRLLILIHILAHRCGRSDQIADDVAYIQCAVQVLKELPENAFTENPNIRQQYPLAKFLFP